MLNDKRNKHAGLKLTTILIDLMGGLFVCLLPCRSKQIQIIAWELGHLKDTINVFYRISKQKWKWTWQIKAFITSLDKREREEVFTMTDGQGNLFSYMGLGFHLVTIFAMTENSSYFVESQRISSFKLLLKSCEVLKSIKCIWFSYRKLCCKNRWRPNFVQKSCAMAAACLASFVIC